MLFSAKESSLHTFLHSALSNSTILCRQPVLHAISYRTLLVFRQRQELLTDHSHCPALRELLDEFPANHLIVQGVIGATRRQMNMQVGNAAPEYVTEYQPSILYCSQ
jgi:hypothetical protein